MLEDAGKEVEWPSPLQETSTCLTPDLAAVLAAVLADLGQVVVDAITPLVPSSSPTRGMDGQWRTGWKNGKTRNIVVKTNTRKARKRNIAKGAQYETIGTITVGTKGAALAIADMAGKSGNRSRGGPRARPNFAGVLNEKIGRGPSRMVWAGGEKAIPDFQKALEPVIKEVIFKANEELMRVKL